MSAIERLLEALDSQIDAALIVSDANRFYFTGFPSSAGTLLITRGQSYFIVDFRYIEIAKKTIQNCEVILQGNLTEQRAARPASGSHAGDRGGNAVSCGVSALRRNAEYAGACRQPPLRCD